MASDSVKVSIIVPVYKVEKYLERCLGSISAQTFRDFELLLVDDGSPDRCGEICEAFAKTNDYTTVIHQANQGLSAARNNAVPHARGQYITFIDSDDFVTPDYLEYLVGLAEKYKADVSVGGRVYQYDDKEPAEPKAERSSGFLSPEEALIRMNYGIDFSVYAWGKLYRRELVEKYPYPVGRLYEDLATTYKIVSDANGVAYGTRQIYYWIQRSDSIMHSGFNERQLDGLLSAEEQLHFIEEHFPNAVPAAKYRLTAKAIELAEICFSSGGSKAVFRKLRDSMNRYASEVMKDPKAKRSMKIRILAMKMGYLPSKAVFSAHRKAKKRKY